ncbi:MAG: thioredoxin family protein [Myxococcales bacterium]|nr:thioredoxin family protein [Myxococcales bacterium]
MRIEAPADAEVATFLRAATARAKREGRAVIVEVGASWCPPCRTLKAAVANGELDDVLAGVTLVAFDADVHGERLDSLGYTSKFIPAFSVPRGDGRASEWKVDVKLPKTASSRDLARVLAPLVEAARK